MDPSSDILDRLIGLHPKIIDLSLDRMHRILARLGHPERALPPVIHVAGTNGKGSTIAYMRAILEASGRSVHVYTSPHLVRFHERVRLAGELVAEAALVEALIECETANGSDPITYFEITTAAALLLFSRTSADVLLLEVGLGGRLDATNVIDRPAATVITPVDIDHAQYLGDTIDLIASEKAGILKRGVPAIIAPQQNDAREVIEARARKLRAPMKLGGQDWHCRLEPGRLVFEDDDGLLDLPPPRLVGRHQAVNAGSAVAALRLAFPDVGEPAIRTAMTTVDWPARLQPIVSGSIVESAPSHAELWLDGGHNPHAGTMLAEVMADREEIDPKPLILIAAMINTKDPTGFFAAFSGLAREVICLPIPGVEAAIDPVTLAGCAADAGVPSGIAEDIFDALRQIDTGDTPPRILICGSLYFAGHVLDLNGTPPR
ncbi:MAG: folylpolyglutamate synthase/dihydrofolate synthase family protein [Pseudomonadota bacterium]